MSAPDPAMEAALLKIAKDLLQASDDLAPTDPAASAKLAHEAYEIGRDLGIVRDHVDDLVEASTVSSVVNGNDSVTVYDRIEGSGQAESPRNGTFVDDETDADLFRILDRQKSMLPTPLELAPTRDTSGDVRSMTFESMPKRSGWFGWMRSREWRHAG
ncbi:MAG: hypothetical protein AAFO01_18560 [Pseudomonadota bacterium]